MKDLKAFIRGNTVERPPVFSNPDSSAPINLLSLWSHFRQIDEQTNWLIHLSRRSEQWRGEEGERRKVTVYEYTWDEEEKEQKQVEVDLRASLERRKTEKASCEVTTHVSIHTLHLDGFRELYRQFLRWVLCSFSSMILGDADA